MKILITHFLLIFTIGAFAQDTITLKPEFEIGKTLKIKIVKKKHKFKAGEISDSEASFGAQYKILSMNDSNIVGEWKYKKPEGIQEESVVLKYMNLMLEGLKYKFVLKPNGEFLKLEDWETVNQTLFKKLDKLSKSDENARYKDQILGIKSLLKNKESIEQAVSKDVQLLFGCYGIKVPVKDSIMVRAEIPNVMGGPSIPAYMSYGIKNQNEITSFKSKLIVNTTFAQPIIDDMLKKYYQMKKINGNASMYKFDFVDVKEHEFRKNKIFQVSLKRTIQYADLVQTDVETIQILK